MIIEKKLKGELGIFFYKIFNDILVLLLVAFSLLLVSESVLPGMVSAYLSFTDVVFMLLSALGMIAYLGKINGLSFEFDNKKTALLGGLMLFSILLIINSLLKFDWWEITIITIAAIFFLSYLYKNFKK